MVRVVASLSVLLPQADFVDGYVRRVMVMNQHPQHSLSHWESHWFMWTDLVRKLVTQVPVVQDGSTHISDVQISFFEDIRLDNQLLRPKIVALTAVEWLRHRARTFST